MSKQLIQFDQSARAWLVGAEFPTDLGNSLIVNISKVAQTTKHMDANQLEQCGVDEYAKLERVYGDKLEDKLNAAARMVHELDQKTPGLKNMLRSNGLGDSPVGRGADYWSKRTLGRTPEEALSCRGCVPHRVHAVVSSFPHVRG
jgi:hypothetical protein